MSVHRFCFAIAVVCATVTFTFCQIRTATGSGGLSSPAELLKKHHVELTRSGLVEALKNPNAEVRYLAAEQLAEDKAQDAVPSIRKALNVEKLPANRVNIAFALAQLGDGMGFSALKNDCDDTAIPGYLRVTAARYLLDLHRESCLSAVIDMLESEADSDSRIQALSLLPSFEQVSKKDSQKIFDLVVKALGDQTAAVKMQASIALGTLGNASAIPYLQSAVANEQDEVVRSTMQTALQRLLEKRKG